MVRLKDPKVKKNHQLSLFQFHYGTIKSSGVVGEAINLYKFQFHYGTIKSFVNEAGRIVIFAFQFHYGTIKSSR